MTFFYTAGHLFRASAAFLVVCGIIALFVRPAPAWLMRSVALLAFILIATSAVVFSAYAAEAFFAYRSPNLYQRFTFELQFRNWFYWLGVVAALLPQLFWFPRLRRRSLPIISISLGAVSPYLFEYAVVGITEYFRPS
jgi:4-amino-4-deoxy-L-arabinose transferase-like glycosyltransferase